MDPALGIPTFFHTCDACGRDVKSLLRRPHGLTCTDPDCAGALRQRRT